MLNGMNTHDVDAVVIGAGIAGASAAAFLAADRRVALLEAEDAPGYHTTGRSAAIWIRNYGPSVVRDLTGLSRTFFEAPPPGFSDLPIMLHRPVLFVAPEEQLESMRGMLAGGLGLREITPEQARDIVPAFRPGWIRAAAMEDDAFDIDVAALLQGYLRTLRRHGGILALRSRAERMQRHNGLWQVAVTDGTEFRAPVLVNAGGAWGDAVARAAGVAPLGLQPKRRTGVIIDPAPWAVTDWPMINDVAHTWYARPEARTLMMISPADETDLEPQDVQPDELDIAIAVDRAQQALDIEVRRVKHAWAGLRSFLPDRTLGIGWDAAAEGFMWCVGQGGYGIQTSPAAGRLVADLVAGRDPGVIGRLLASLNPNRFAHHITAAT
jgi:D-arginine dehydrogenase